jgi:hypothetical protein
MKAPVRFAPTSTAPALREELARHGLALAAFDGTGISDAPALLKALGQALAFPAYYGANWDAAEECLGDLGSAIPRAALSSSIMPAASGSACPERWASSSPFGSPPATLSRRSAFRFSWSFCWRASGRSAS